MPLNIKQAKDVATEPPLIVIYAEPGAGKTTCAAMLGKKNPKKSLLVDFDESAIVIERVCPEMPIIQPENFVEMEELLHAFRTDSDDVKDFQNVIIDTLTSGEDMILWESMKSKGKRVPEIANYNERYAILRQFIRDLKILNRNIIAVCHEMEFELEEDNLHDLGTSIKITRKMPKLSGKLSNALVGSADIVLRLAIREDIDPKDPNRRNHTRVFQTQKTDRVWAKDRTNLLPKVMPADLREVLKAWHRINGYAKKAAAEPKEGE